LNRFFRIFLLLLLIDARTGPVNLLGVASSLASGDQG
jgi:hypothetical protein